MARKYSKTELLWLWLSTAKSLTPADFMYVLGEVVDIEFLFDNHAGILKKLDLSQRKKDEMASLLSRPLYEDYIDKLDKQGIYAVTRLSPDYPMYLQQIPWAPNVLYVRGDISKLGDRCVSMVGTRKATDFGIRFAAGIARDVASSGVPIVSGIAVGIDSAAHLGAMEGGGVSYAVLPDGVDQIYPKANERLAQRIMEQGALISEHPPGFKGDKSVFSRRNRIIAGISPCLYIGEAPQKSGAAITLDLALDYNREIFTTAFPKSVTFDLANSLVEDGAIHVESAAELLVHMGWARLKEDARETVTAPYIDDEKAASEDEIDCSGEINLDFFAHQIYTLLLKGQFDVDELKGRLKCSSRDLNSAITIMELDGTVMRMPGNAVRLTKAVSAVSAVEDMYANGKGRKEGPNG